MKLSVVIPTYRRPSEMDRCLSGIAAQQRPADQVVVVVRDDDTETQELMIQWSGRLPLTICTISVPGVVQALNLGLDYVTGDIVTITDDDTFALQDWLARIEAHFAADPQLGGLGGRDVIHQHGMIEPENDGPVGLILPYGRLIGNHPHGRGPARVVDHLKGVNMSWRMSALDGRRFATGLRGSGAQVYFELAFSLDMQRHGWKLVYDPAIQINHYPGQRHDNDNRAARDLKALENSAYNLYIALRCYMQHGLRRTLALMWVHYLGSFGHPGVLRGIQYRLTGNKAGVELRQVTAKAWHDAKHACGEK